MQLVHTIKKADVGDGVYRHPLRDPRRAWVDKTITELERELTAVSEEEGQ